MPEMVVRIRIGDLPLRWLAAVADLLRAVEDADPIMVEGPIREAADEVHEIIWRGIGP